jgi:hypothetical protein
MCDFLNFDAGASLATVKSVIFKILMQVHPWQQ